MAENERLARLEADMKALIGNGQPGRIDKIESKQEAHGRFIYIGVGILAVLQVLAANGLLRLH